MAKFRRSPAEGVAIIQICSCSKHASNSSRAQAQISGSLRGRAVREALRGARRWQPRSRYCACRADSVPAQTDHRQGRDASHRSGYRGSRRLTSPQLFVDQVESDLPTGSFKPRGALNALLTTAAQRPVPGVVAASTGNHGAAVAYAARIAKIGATIFLQENPNPVKRARIVALGAKVVERGAMG